MAKAIALLSGGLDSSLAVKMMVEQGVEVHALNFTSSFCTCNAGRKTKAAEGAGCSNGARALAAELGIPIKTMVKGLEYMEVVRSPRYGYGKGINPCIDCRIYMFKAAKEYMLEIGADFIITGEVIGQRPMSQRRDAFRTVERESGLEGLILRPLCAKHLDETIPEKTGLIDRNTLMDISGRGRKPQMELAEELNITDYPCPSGGCLLTDKIFSKKVKDLLDHSPTLTIKDLQTLKVGRHFRIGGAKIVISKNEMENTSLKGLLQPGHTLIEPFGFPGPVAIVCEDEPNGAVETAARLLFKYAPKAPQTGCRVTVTRNGEITEMEVTSPLGEVAAKEALVC
ncbi:MAG: hypothetical protein OEV59_07980 [Deltaproteobacteria bacterium]|nr:hypothetical protein [Deltaproteobacteria bacterium]